MTVSQHAQLQDPETEAVILHFIIYSERVKSQVLLPTCRHTGCHVVSLEGMTKMTMSFMWWWSCNVWSQMSANHTCLLIGSNTWYKMLITHQWWGVDYLQPHQRTPLPRAATVLCITVYCSSVQLKLKSISIITDSTPVLLQICLSELSAGVSVQQRCFMLY